MRKPLLLLLLGASLALASAQEEPDVETHLHWMNMLDWFAYDMEEGIEEQFDLKVMYPGEVVQDLLRRTERFWADAGHSDIAALARTNVDQTQRVIDAAEAGDWETAAEAARQLRATCAVCHDLQPEQRLQGNGATQ